MHALEFFSLCHVVSHDVSLAYDEKRKELLSLLDAGFNLSENSTNNSFYERFPHRSAAERGAWSPTYMEWYRELQVKSDSVTEVDRRPVFMTVVCNQGRDYRTVPSRFQISRALRSSCALDKLGSKVRKWALTYGFDNASLASLRAGGFLIRDMSHIHPARFALSPINAVQVDLQKKGKANPSSYRKMPQTLGIGPKEVQYRRDYVCTSVKLLAWNLTEHPNILLVDSDVIMLEDPFPWMLKHASELFIAEAEQANRMYMGLNTKMVYFQPNQAIFEMLRRASISANFVPYTNSDQDVIESILTSPGDIKMPNSNHSKELAHDHC